MSDQLDEKEYGESFWNDVDSLRAFLEEEEREDAQNKSKDPGFLTAEEPLIPEEPPMQEKPLEETSVKRRRPAGKPSGFLLAVLYLIIVLEIAAIVAVGVSWYLWMH